MDFDYRIEEKSPLPKYNERLMKAACYSLGIIEPTDNISSITKHDQMRAAKKIEQWQRYGNIIAMTNILQGNERLKKFWLLTNKKVVIVACIKKRQNKLFTESWSVGDFGICVEDDSDFRVKDFVEQRPDTLVFDDSVDKILTDSFGDYLPTWLTDYTIEKPLYLLDVFHTYAKSLKWVKRIVFPAYVQFSPINYCYGYYPPGSWHRIHDRSKRLPDFFRDDIQCEFARESPYFLKQGIIYLRENKKEVVCLNNVINEKRYEEVEHQEDKKWFSKWRQEGKCQFCGGKFEGGLLKKCSKCGKRKNY